MILNNDSEFAGLDALGIADVVMAAAMLKQSSKSNKLNSDNISENQKVISLLTEISQPPYIIHDVVLSLVD